MALKNDDRKWAYPTNPDRNKPETRLPVLDKRTKGKLALTKSRQKRQNGKDHLKNSDKSRKERKGAL